MPEIDAHQPFADLRALAAIGRFNTGAHSPTYSFDDMAGRLWFLARRGEARFDTAMDIAFGCQTLADAAYAILLGRASCGEGRTA